MARGDTGICLHLAHFTLLELWERGYAEPGCEGAVMQLQAGSLQWLCTRHRDDDGIRPTHFAYMWDSDHPLNGVAVWLGHLPEMHVWVGCVEPRQLVDLSTGSLMQDCEEKLGVPWLADPPPEYLWADGRTPPAALYEPCFSATWYAMLKIWEMYRPEYARPVGMQAEEHNVTLEKVLEYEKRQEAKHASDTHAEACV